MAWANITETYPDLVVAQWGPTRKVPVAASTKIYAGSLVNLSSAYAVPGQDTAADVFVGVALETIDNSSGADGDKDIMVATDCLVRVKASGALAIGTKVYCSATDPVTVTDAAGATNDVEVGEVWHAGGTTSDTLVYCKAGLTPNA